MLIGRRAVVKCRPTKEQNLVEWSRPLLNNTKKLSRILDPRIDGQYTLKAMMRVANMAYQCLSENPKGRPLMSQVVDILETIYKQEASHEQALLRSGGGVVTLYEVPNGDPNVSPDRKALTISESKGEDKVHRQQRNDRSNSKLPY
ncbi:hypothetical protein Dimus_010860 [Dionaea muscipula]